MDHYGTCSGNIQEVCQKTYAMDGPVTSSSGLKKCRQQLKEKEKWGRDNSELCKRDPEKCNHAGCGYVVETRGFKDYANLVREQEPYMKKASDVYKEAASQKMADVQGKFKGFMGSFGKKQTPVQGGGARRKTIRRRRIGGKSRKSRKPRTRKPRKSKKHARKPGATRKRQRRGVGRRTK